MGAVDTDDLPSTAETFPVLRWIPWGEPPPAPDKAAGRTRKRPPSGRRST
jgi:hypothetical protein